MSKPLTNPRLGIYVNVNKEFVYYDPNRENKTVKDTVIPCPITHYSRWSFAVDATAAAKELITDKIQAGPNPELELAKWTLKINKTLVFDKDLLQFKKVQKVPMKYPVLATTLWYHPAPSQTFFWDYNWPSPKVIEDESYRNQPY